MLKRFFRWIFADEITAQKKADDARLSVILEEVRKLSQPAPAKPAEQNAFTIEERNAMAQRIAELEKQLKEQRELPESVRKLFDGINVKQRIEQAGPGRKPYLIEKTDIGLDLDLAIGFKLLKQQTGSFNRAEFINRAIRAAFEAQFGEVLQLVHTNHTDAAKASTQRDN